MGNTPVNAHLVVTILLNEVKIFVTMQHRGEIVE